MNMDRFCFRVYDKKNKQYIDGVETEMFINNDASLLFDSFGSVVFPPEEQSNYIIEQCTGLSDKNGKLIYEGDIIRINDDFHTDDDVLIVWKNYAFRCEDVAADGYYNLLCELLPEHIEIIGNIHEQKDNK